MTTTTVQFDDAWVRPTDRPVLLWGYNAPESDATEAHVGSGRTGALARGRSALSTGYQCDPAAVLHELLAAQPPHPALTHLVAGQVSSEDRHLNFQGYRDNLRRNGQRGSVFAPRFRQAGTAA